MKTTRTLASARVLADAIMRDLAPVCQRVEVAGSVRRCKPEVQDIEIVAIPRFESAGLFGDQQQNALWRYLTESPLYRFLKGNNPDGRFFQVEHVSSGIQVDIFTTPADAFGWCLLVRTGSATFSQSVLVEWKRLKGLGKDQQGSKDGHLVDRYGRVYETPEEQGVFRLLGLDWIEPRDRHDDARRHARRLVRP